MANKKVTTLFNYIGGKSWLKEYLRKEVTELLVENKSSINGSLNTYVEPFAGGLGAFLGIYDILYDKGIQHVILNDINTKLIQFYNIVNTVPEELIEKYMLLENEYAQTIPSHAKLLHKTKEKLLLKPLLAEAETFFKAVRKSFNQSQDALTNSVNLLFLQNHCFNGVYRENSRGEYNTPFNWETKVFNEEKVKEKIIAVAEVFKKFNIQFTNKSFQDLNYMKNALYYLDPPYVNEIETQENQYNKDSFNMEKQKQLIEMIKDVPFLYSNHDNDILLQEFNKNKIAINVQRISRKNIISASNESRKIDKIEILISSF